MNFLNKMERKFGKYAIPNLVVYLLIGYAIGYVVEIIQPALLSYLTLEPAYILRGQIWRLITWVLIPPSGSIYGYGILFVLIMMWLYYSLGTTLERVWGTFRFNVYIFGGMLFTILGAFVLYGIYYLLTGMSIVGMGGYFSTSYINESIFLAFAVMFPEAEVRLYFILPIKMKWMAIVYGVLILLEIILGNWATRVACISSLLNFLIFFLLNRKRSRNPFQKATRRNNPWANAMGGGPKKQEEKKERPFSGSFHGVAKHKCAICGRTNMDDPSLEFRFCSKCNGNYEYCQEHLFTHRHVE